MTVVPQSAPSPWAQYGSNVGMEDVSAGDLRIPRLRINGPKAVFENTVSKEAWPNLRVVVLGLIKQRSWFPPVTKDTENGPPVCKSNDFSTGFPTDPFHREKQPYHFPWQQSKLNPQGFPIDQELGRVVLPCESCNLKEWVNNEPPTCQEVHTYALLYQDESSGELHPAMLSIKSSSIKNSRGFISSFASQSRPFFTAWTDLSLTQAQRGQVLYCTVNFNPIFDMQYITPQDKWDGWVKQFETVREMTRQPPRPFEEDGSAPEAKQNNNGATVEGTVVSDSGWQSNPGAQAPWAGYASNVPDGDSSPVGVASTGSGPIPAPAPSTPATPATAPHQGRTPAPAPDASAPPVAAPTAPPEPEATAPTPPPAPPAPEAPPAPPAPALSTPPMPGTSGPNEKLPF